jgi:AhpD family alkylhydroperoxidase
MTYRFFTPAPARRATGLTAQVYQQLREDFLGPVPAFQALSPAPDLLAATWNLIREALIAGSTPRIERELVASAVSRANHCRFCVDAHVMLLHALGEHKLAEVMARGEMPATARHADLVRWAEMSRTPIASGWKSRFGPEITGTLLAFHFLNRMVSALLDPDLLPGGMQRSGLVRSAAGRLYGKSAGAFKEPGSNSVDAAYAALKEIAVKGGELLSEEGRDTVAAAVRWEDGRYPDQPAEWAADFAGDLPVADRLSTRIALLAAFAPSAIKLEEVALRRRTHPDDADLVRLIAYGAITATDHVARSLTRV